MIKKIILIIILGALLTGMAIWCIKWDGTGPNIEESNIDEGQKREINLIGRSFGNDTELWTFKDDRNIGITELIDGAYKNKEGAYTVKDKTILLEVDSEKIELPFFRKVEKGVKYIIVGEKKLMEQEVISEQSPI